MNLKRKSGVILALAVCSAVYSARADYPSTVLSQAPVAYYRLGENATVSPLPQATNLGSYAINGTYTADPPRGLPGPLGAGNDSAVSFDGVSQWVTIPYNATLNPAAFTIEAWLNPATASPSGGLLCPLASMHSGVPRSGWLIYQSGPGGVGNGWVLRTYAQYGPNPNGSTPADGTSGLVAVTNLTAGTWYHVVGTFDGTTVNMYVNGVLLASGPSTFVPNVDAQFEVGARSDNGFPWPGEAAEVAYYSSALTPATVKAHYDAATTNKTGYATQILAASPIVYLRLNEPGEPISPNLGTFGAAANASYVFNAMPGQPGPQSPEFKGFDAANQSVGFDGNSGFVKIPPLNLNSANVTMTAWVNLNGAAENANAGIVYSDSGATQAGLKFDIATQNGLAYNWSSSTAAGFDSTLVIPAGPQWAFVALITAPDHAVLALQDGNSFQYSTNFTTLGALPFAGVTLIGSDAGGSALTFNGNIDEVAIFNRSLGLGEVYTEYAAAAGTNPPVVFLDPQAPANQVFVGDTLNLVVDAGATPPYSYQWKKGSSTIAGANTSAYTIPSVALTDSASYSVVVSNAYGVATSASASITVNPLNPPVISQDPIGRTLYPGGSLGLSVTASGGALVYQWKQGGAPIPGATNSAYNVASVVATNAGTYTVFVTNKLGTATSQPAVVTVITPTAGSYEQAVVTDGPEAWWRLNDAGSEVMQDTLGRHDGVYNGGITPGAPGLPGSSTTSATFDGQVGSFASVPYTAILNSDTFSLEIWVQTADQTSEMGVVSSFSSGSSSPYKGKGYFLQRVAGDNFEGDIGLNDQYEYYYITLGANIPSKWTQLVVTYGVGGLIYYQDGKVSTGGYADFVHNTSNPFLIGAILPGQLDYYWNGQIADVTYYTKTLTAAQISNHYQSGLYGTNSKPVFLSQPASQTVSVGANVTFSAAVEGSVPISLQWTKNGSPIASATNSALTLNNVFFTDAADYVLTATNSSGSSNSVTATLTILASPQFINATNGLVLHLKFDGDFKDSSGQGNDGTAVGAPTFVSPGKIGSKALHYSTATAGNISGGAVTEADYVTLGTPPDLAFNDSIDFSVAYWIRTATNAETGDLPIFCTMIGSYGGSGYDFAPSYKAGGWSYSLNGTVQLYGAANSINNGQWHSLVHTFSRTGNAITYLDGVVVDTRPDAAAGNIDTGNPTTIGQDPTGQYTEPGAADVDDIGVWTRVLTPYEATAIYSIGQKGTTFDTYGPVTMTLQKVGSSYGIVWQAGTLLSSPTLTGPYTPVAGAAAPFYQFTPGGGAKFFRVELN